jgi:hypothetical protein
MQPAQSAGLLGSVSFVDRDVRQNLLGIELHGDSVRVKRAGSNQAMTT